MIFVVGSSRSGTTMTGRILGRNAQVFMYNELHFFEQEWQPADAARLLPEDEALALLVRLMSTQRDGYFYRHDNPAYHGEAAALGQTIGLGDRTHAKHDLLKAFAQHEAGLHGKHRWCEQTPRNVYFVDEKKK